MIFAGIDFSMSSPAITVYDSSKPLKFENCVAYSLGNYSRVKLLEGNHGNISIIKQPTYSCNEERFANIVRWAKAVMVDAKVQTASLEGYAYGAKGSVFEIGEITGLLKNMLFQMKIPFHVIEPTVVKKLATGNGAAKKELMYNKFTQSQGVFIEGLLGYYSMTDKKVVAKLETAPWELKPVDDIIDSYYVLTSHPDLKV